MKQELISKATRNDFREVLTGLALHDIDMVFESGGMSPLNDYVPQVSGERRSRVEKYYANVNFYDPGDALKVATAFGELMLGSNPFFVITGRDVLSEDN